MGWYLTSELVVIQVNIAKGGFLDACHWQPEGLFKKLCCNGWCNSEQKPGVGHGKRSTSELLQYDFQDTSDNSQPPRTVVQLGQLQRGIPRWMMGY